MSLRSRLWELTLLVRGFEILAASSGEATVPHSLGKGREPRAENNRMLTRNRWLVLASLVSALGLVLSSAGALSAEQGTVPAQTFRDAGGTTYYAIGLQMPPVAVAAEGWDLVILVDTSAPRAGAFRQQQLELLESLVQQAKPEDQNLPAGRGFESGEPLGWICRASSPEMQAALARFRQRAPLGSDGFGGRPAREL